MQPAVNDDANYDDDGDQVNDDQLGVAHLFSPSGHLASTAALDDQQELGKRRVDLEHHWAVAGAEATDLPRPVSVVQQFHQTLQEAITAQGPRFQRQLRTVTG